MPKTGEPLKSHQNKECLMSTPLDVRIKKSAEVLGVPTEQLRKALDEAGIANNEQGLLIIDSTTVTLEDIIDVITIIEVPSYSYSGPVPLGDIGKRLVHPFKSRTPILKIKAAAGMLKDTVASEMPAYGSFASVATLSKGDRPIQQFGDRELVEKYALNRYDEVVEDELQKRSNSHRFIVLKEGPFEPGKEEIDIEGTVGMLKKARRMVTPSFLPLDSAKITPIYSIVELSASNRIIELCPRCEKLLFRGFCETCSMNLSGVGEYERAYMQLIFKYTGQVIWDKNLIRSIVVSALKGLEDLRLTWPVISGVFDDLKAKNKLPILRIISNRPSVINKAHFYFKNET
jgi:hypothetical protein